MQGTTFNQFSYQVYHSWQFQLFPSVKLNPIVTTQQETCGLCPFPQVSLPPIPVAVKKQYQLSVILCTVTLCGEKLPIFFRLVYGL